MRSLVAQVQDPASSCLNARDLAQEYLVAVRAKLAELKGLERSIRRELQFTCAGGAGPDCVILDDLSKGRTATPGASAGRRTKINACS